MIDKERSPTEASFLPPSQFAVGLEPNREATPSKSARTNLTDHQDMVPIEISLVVKFRNRHGQEIRTERDVVLTREDFQRFQIAPNTSSHKPKTEDDRRSVFFGTESNVSQQLYQPKESRTSTEQGLQIDRQPRDTNDGVRTMKLPSYTSAFKKVVGRECAYSPVGGNARIGHLRTPQPIRHWHHTQPATPNQLTIGPQVPISTPATNLPIRFSGYESLTNLPHQYNQGVSARSYLITSPERTLLSERRPYYDSHSTPISAPPTRFVTLNLSGREPEAKGIADTRVTNIHQYPSRLEEESKSMSSSHSSQSQSQNITKSRKIIKLRGRVDSNDRPSAEVEKPKDNDLKLEKKNSGIRVTSKKDLQQSQQSPQPQQQQTLRQSFNMPLSINKPKSTEQIAPPKIILDQINKSQNKNTTTQQPPTVSMNQPEMQEQIHITDPTRAAQPLARPVQTPVQQPLGFRPGSIAATNYYNPPTELFRIEPVRPINRDSLVNTIVAPQNVHTEQSNQPPLNNSQRYEPTDRPTPPLPPTVFPRPESVIRHSVPQPTVFTYTGSVIRNSQSAEKPAGQPSEQKVINSIRQTISMNDQPQIRERPKQKPPSSSQHIVLVDSRNSQALPPRPPSNTGISTPQKQGPAVEQGAGTASQNRSNSMKPVQTSEGENSSRIHGRGRSTSPHKIFPPRPHSSSRMSAPIEASGPFAYLINCKDQPRAYRRETNQLDAPANVLEAWNRR